jgi:CheY-like chemotaxis protein
MRDEHGSITGFESVITDVTAGKRLEEQLREARKLEAIGRLAGGIAHDFDTALGAITHNLESALERLPPDHPARPPADQAHHAAQSAMALTGQLLSFSRKPDNTAEARHQPVPEGPETILLVEDDPLVRELSRDMLERQGYRVILAAEALEAERIGPQTHFDLLITDIRMASMTGEELARRLRSIHPDLRVLFVEGYEDPPRDQTQPILPGTGFITRPFSADSLGRRIRQILSR